MDLGQEVKKIVLCMLIDHFEQTYMQKQHQKYFSWMELYFFKSQLAMTFQAIETALIFHLYKFNALEGLLDVIEAIL